jgi:hypothetical protein
MSIWKLRVGAENYYLSQVANGVEDYYTGRGEVSGRWLGTAVTGLGLSLGDTVDGDDLRGRPRRSPTRERAVTERRPTDRVHGSSPRLRPDVRRTEVGVCPVRVG